MLLAITITQNNYLVLLDVYKRQAVKAANKENGHAQIALSYTLGDAYTLDYWKETAKRIEDMGANSLCIKDMAEMCIRDRSTVQICCQNFVVCFLL